jgi:hypothetical protein
MTSSIAFRELRKSFARSGHKFENQSEENTFLHRNAGLADAKPPFCQQEEKANVEHMALTPQTGPSHPRWFPRDPVA